MKKRVPSDTIFMTQRKGTAQLRTSIALLSMMLPGIIYFIINNYIPMAGLVVAFKRFDYSKGIWDSSWTGFGNFTYLFRTQDALNIIRNTIGYNLIFIILGGCSSNYAEFFTGKKQ